MTEDMRHMDPSTLEMFLILKYSKDLWDARTIDAIINKDAATALLLVIWTASILNIVFCVLLYCVF